MKSPHSKKESAPNTTNSSSSSEVSRQRKFAAVAVTVAAGILVAACGQPARTPADKPIETPASNSVSPHPTPTPTPKPSHTAAPKPRFSMHQNIMTTEFWVGEPADADNHDISNTMSTWDEDRQKHYGGFDNPDRSTLMPTGFTPKENPFYFALPYSDLGPNDVRRSTAKNCLGQDETPDMPTSWCKNNWIKVTYNGKTAFGQWEDAGPFGENDTDYVFGSAEPRSSANHHAGLDVSPALTLYLGLSGMNRTSWQFVDAEDVPEGPWTQIVTDTPGRTAE
jgi:hypothetical protein